MTDRERERQKERERRQTEKEGGGGERKERQRKREEERAETSGKAGDAAVVPNEDNERISVLDSVARLIKREDSCD